MRRVSIVIIATSKIYIGYAKEMIKSIDLFFAKEDLVEIILFTDLPGEVGYSPTRLSIKEIQIDALRWPYASLLRYRMIKKHAEHISGNYVFYMDADLLFLSDTNLNELILDSEEMSFVRHPGFYNRNPLYNFGRRFYSPPWEVKRSSSAFVPFIKRNVYIAGGVWGGGREAFFSFVNKADEWVEVDLANNFFARSYDESYLNRWITENSKFHLLTPKYLFADGYKNLRKISSPKILALAKEPEVHQGKVDFIKSNKRTSN